MASHTNTPWTIRNAVIVDSTPDVGGKFVGECPLLETCPDVAANRRHVVKCVNAHDELILMLELNATRWEDLHKHLVAIKAAPDLLLGTKMNGESARAAVMRASHL